jgi:hypothetical protein
MRRQLCTPHIMTRAIWSHDKRARATWVNARACSLSILKAISHPDRTTRGPSALQAGAVSYAALASCRASLFQVLQLPQDALAFALKKPL